MMKKAQPGMSGRAGEENRTMITAIVQYKLPPHIDLAACAAHFRSIAPDFRAVPGLIRKQFIYAEDGWAGGVYLWAQPRRRRGLLLRSLAPRHP